MNRKRGSSLLYWRIFSFVLIVFLIALLIMTPVYLGIKFVLFESASKKIDSLLSPEENTSLGENDSIGDVGESFEENMENESAESFTLDINDIKEDNIIEEESAGFFEENIIGMNESMENASAINESVGITEGDISNGTESNVTIEGNVSERIVNASLGNMSAENASEATINVSEENISGLEVASMGINGSVSERIMIGKQVRWTKKVKIEERGVISLPKEAENIVVKKAGEEILLSPAENSKFSFIELLKKILSVLTGRVSGDSGTAEIIDNIDSKQVIFSEAAEYEIEFTTPAPSVTEEMRGERRKRVVVSAPDLGYRDILTFTSIPEVLRVGQENSIRVFWVEQKRFEPFSAFDSDDNGFLDYIEWNTPYLSEQSFEISLAILTVQSYPIVGGNWTVEFNTTGEADLKIYASNGTKWTDYADEGYDLKFLEIRCGENVMASEFIKESAECETGACYAIVRNYSCDKSGYETSKVLTPGKHTLRFEFGSQIDYAFNLACGNINQCGPLDVPDCVYNLTADIDSFFATCFSVTANNVKLNGNGFTVYYGTNPNIYGIRVMGNNTIIKNIQFLESSSGSGGGRAAIYIDNSNNITINNTLTITRLSGSINLLVNSSKNSIFSNNAVNSSANSGGGLYLFLGGNNTVYNNSIVANSGSFGAKLENTTNNNISKINIATAGTSSHGIIFRDGTGNYLSNINVTTVEATSHGIHVLSGNSSAVFFDSIINASQSTSNDFNSVGGAVGIGGAINFTNTIFSNNRISVGSNIRINVHWYLDAYANYSNGTAASGVNISLRDNTNALIFSNLTNSSGRIQQRAILSYWQDMSSKVDFNNHTINATKSGYVRQSKSINITSNRFEVFTMPLAEDVVECMSLPEPNKAYKLVQNIIKSTGDGSNCISINVENVSLDGRGFTINSSSNSGYAINIDQKAKNVSIKNIKFVDGLSASVHTNLAKNVLIINNSISNIGDGVHLYGSTDFTTANVISNNITVIGTGRGIFLEGLARSNISFNNITTFGTNSRGIYFEDEVGYKPDGNAIFRNIIKTNGSSSIGIYIAYGNSQNISYNVIEIKGDNSYGIYANNVVNISVRDLNVSIFGVDSQGIRFFNVNNSLIENSIFSLNKYNSEGISLRGVNNIIKNNTVTNASYGIWVDNPSRNSSITNNKLNLNNYGIYLGSYVSNNTIINNILDSNNYSIYLLASTQNSISGGVINNSRAIAIYLEGGATKWNNFTNITIINTNVSGYDIYGIGLVNWENYFVDMPYIGNYSFTNFQGGTFFSFKNSKYGEIKFLQPSNATGNNLTRDIFIGNNSVIVRSDLSIGLNRSANIALYGIGNRFNRPVIMKNGIECRKGCWNFTALNSDVVVFNVSSWTEYSIGEFGMIPSCAELDSENGVYTLISNVSSDGTCFTISANNITLNCNISYINYSRAEGSNNYGVYVNGANYTTIKNCTIMTGSINGQYNHGIYLNRANNSVIFNNSIVTLSSGSDGIYLYSAINTSISENRVTTFRGRGIGLASGSNYTIIKNNFIEIFNIISATSRGIDIQSSSYNFVENNTIRAYNYLSRGATLINSNNNFIIKNNITTSGDEGYGIILFSSSSNIIGDNKIRTYADDSAGIDISSDSTNNSLFNMSIVTDGAFSHALSLGWISNDPFSANFSIRDSILNASNSGATDFYIWNTLKSGEWNFTNVTRADGISPINITWQAGANGTLNMHWYLDAYANYSNGTEASNANISAYNVSGAISFSALTDSNGRIARQILLGYWRNATFKGDQNNYTFNATNTAGFRNVTQSWNMTTNRMLAFTFGDLIPPLIFFVPPTPANGSSVIPEFVNINVSIVEENLNEVKFNWNGTNYTMYNDSLLLMFNFDNRSELGENDTFVRDLSRYMRNGNVSGPRLAAGRYGKGFYFNNSNDFINITNKQGLDNLGASSVCAWIYPRSFGTNGVTGRIYSKRQYEFMIWNKSATSDCVGPSVNDPAYRGESLWFFIDDNGDNFHVAGQEYFVRMNQWQHACMTWSGGDSSNVQLYINGVNSSERRCVNELNGVRTPDSPYYPMIGNRPGSTVNAFNGTIDEVRVWNRTLSHDEIREQYMSNLYKYNQTQWYLYVNQSNLSNGAYTYFASAKDTYGNENMTETRTVNVDSTVPGIEFVPPTPDNASITGGDVYVNVSSSDNNGEHSVILDWNNSLVLWLRMDDRNESGDLVDRSTYSNNGTRYGATYTTAGKFGGALNFDGINDYVNLGRQLEFNFGAKDFSYSVWTKTPASFNAPARIISDDMNSDNVRALIIRSNSRAEFICRDANNNYFDIESPTPVNDNEWHYVVGVRNGSTAFLYLDGKEVNRSTNNLVGSCDGGARTFIGGRDASPLFFNGSIDDAQIYKRALTPEEINASYNASLYKYHRNFTNLDSGEYRFKAYAQDLAGNLNWTEERTVNVDSSAPLIEFVPPTPDNATTVGPENVNINVSIIEENLREVKFNWNGTNFSIYDDSLLLFMNFDNRSELGENDTLVSDLSRYGNNGLVKNGAFWVHFFNDDPTNSMLSQSGLSAFDPTAIVDNNIASQGWHTDSASAGAWLKIDLGANKDYVKARIYAFNPNYVGIYDIQYSDDDFVSDIRTAVSGFNPNLLGWNEITWSNVGAHRYWRFFLTNTPGGGAWLNELEMYERGGRYGGAYQFDGIDDYIKIENASMLNTSVTDITISAWVKLRDFLGNRNTNYEIFSNEQNLQFGYLFRIQDYNILGEEGKIYFRVNNAGYDEITAPSMTYPNDKNWHYLTAVKLGSSGKIYLDGREVASDTLSINPADSSSESRIGGLEQYFNGSIDEVRIWRRGLSADEVKELYLSNLHKYNKREWSFYVNQKKNSTAWLDFGNYTYFAYAKDIFGNENMTETRTVYVGDVIAPRINFTFPTPANGSLRDKVYPEINVSISEYESNLGEVKFNWNGTNYTVYNDSLILMFNFDNRTSLGEDYGTPCGLIRDLSGRGNNGYISNSGCGAANMPYWSSSGKYGGALGFNRTSTNVARVPASDSLNNLQRMTLAVWVYKDGNMAVDARIVNKEGAGDTAYGIQTEETDSVMANRQKPKCEMNINGLKQHLASNQLPLREWTYIVCTYDGSAINIYVNGERANTPLVVSGAVEVFNSELSIGNVLPTFDRRFNGLIDEARIWNRALSAEEIREMYMLNLNKYDNNNWSLFVRQGKNETAPLDLGNYTYFASAKDIYGNENMTETRVLLSALGIVDIDDLGWVNINPGNINNIRFSTYIFNSCGGECAGNIINASFYKDSTVRDDPSCDYVGALGAVLNYSCTVGIWYFDNAGEWSVNVTFVDGGNAYKDSREELFNLLEEASVSHQGALDYGILDPGTTPNLVKDFLLNNTGNVVFSEIRIEGNNLLRNDIGPENIPASNFRVDDIFGSACSATQMSSGTSILIPGVTLQIGNNSINNRDASSGQEELFVCLTTVPGGLSGGNYRAGGANSWELTTVPPHFW